LENKVLEFREKIPEKSGIPRISQKIFTSSKVSRWININSIFCETTGYDICFIESGINEEMSKWPLP
jgi:hypothetical protein